MSLPKHMPKHMPNYFTPPVQQIPAKRASGNQLANTGNFGAAAAGGEQSEHATCPNWKRWPVGCLKRLAPQVGLEPTTLRLTAGCSATRSLILKGIRTVQRHD